MTKYQEALNWLRVSTSSKEHNERFELLQELVDKEVPIKVVIDEDTNQEMCPKCTNYRINNEYCEHCGQALDWSS